MLIAAQIVSISLLALLANYLLNQLPPLRDFPGKNVLLVRLLLYFVIVQVSYEVLSKETSVSVAVFWRYAMFAVVGLLLFDIVKLVRVLWCPAKNRASVVDVDISKKERKNLLAKMHRQVKGVLEDTVSQPSLGHLYKLPEKVSI